MKPTLQHFETFLAVAETRGFTSAAKILGHSKASVSQSIRLLEQSLGVSLFNRSTRRVYLTEEGKLLFAQCQRLKKELDIARELVVGFNTSPTGRLRISCNPYFAESQLLNILQKYMTLYPNVRVEVMTEERMPNMQQEQIDIVFGVNWPAPDDVVAKIIAHTRYVLCASPEYLSTFGIPKKLNDLMKHRYIAHYGRSEENIITSLKKPMALNLSSKLTLNNAHLMKQCALSNMGIIQLHDYMVKKELQKGELVEVLPEHFNEKIPLYIYFQKHRFVQPKIMQFVGLCSN